MGRGGKGTVKGTGRTANMAGALMHPEAGGGGGSVVTARQRPSPRSDVTDFVDPPSETNSRTHPHSVHRNGGNRFSPIPRQKVGRQKQDTERARGEGGGGNGGGPWLPAPVPTAGEYSSSPPSSKNPTDKTSPSRTRIFDEKEHRCGVLSPSPPRKGTGGSRSAGLETNKFNCCKQVRRNSRQNVWMVCKTF